MSYGFKLLVLSLAAFFIVHAAAAVLSGWFVPRAIRAAARMRARAAARFLLMVRFAPVTIATVVVAGLCVPSYLWFEPDAAAEEASPLCLAAAFLCLATWALGLLRGARAIRSSRRAKSGAMALVGVIRPHVVVSSEARRVLSAEQLDAALRHEYAHAGAHDNLKRLLLLLAPDAWPCFRGRLANLDSAWKKFAEWAADDEAVHGDPACSVALASALVSVARLGLPAQSAPLITSLTDGDFAARVNRLLNAPPQGHTDRWTPAVVTVSAVLLGTVMAQPDSLTSIYGLLERLIR